jgi:hypothetical protein
MGFLPFSRVLPAQKIYISTRCRVETVKNKKAPAGADAPTDTL